MIKIQLKTNKQEQQRIDQLLYDVTENSDSRCIVAVEYLDIQAFLGENNNANLEVLNTDNVNDVALLMKKPLTRYNFCIIEIKNIQDVDLVQIEKLFANKKELVAIVINNTLSKKYRIDYLYK